MSAAAAAAAADRDVALDIDAPSKKTQQEPTPKKRIRTGARDGRRKEDAFRDGGRVLESDAVETRIIRENTRCHPDVRTVLRSLCFGVLLTVLIYVCLILQDVRSFLFKAQEKLDDMSSLTTSVGDLETTLVDIRDSVSNTTHVSNFIQETFSSLTGDVTLEETLGSLGDALARHVKWKKLGDTLASDIQWEKVLSNVGSALTKTVKWKKIGDTLEEEIQWEKILTTFGDAVVKKMDAHNLSRKDENTGARYIHTRGPGCVEGNCSGWLM